MIRTAGLTFLINRSKRMIIRSMAEPDRRDVLEMMTVFYASEAVSTNGSYEIFTADIDACVGETPFLSGHVFEHDGNVVGYGMLAHSYSTEFGKPCVWIEDLYVKPEYRGQGIGRQYLDFVNQSYQNHVIRLEAEKENEKAVKVYEANGFTYLPYAEMIKL